jgi:hypothetical protein
MRQTKRANAKSNDKTNAKTPDAQIPASEEDDDPVPEDIDEFRNALARKIARFIGDRQGYWRGCKERSCRRQRACVAPRIRCSNAPPLEPVTPEQQARTMALVYRQVHERIAQRDGERMELGKARGGKKR